MATITANSVEAADVQAALNAASSGDIVEIPAGTANWSQQVTWSVPANVILRGAGTSAVGGGDQTIIQDNYGVNSPLFVISVSSTGFFRMTGITFRSGTGTTKDGGTIQIGGPGSIRIDHCHFIATSSANYKVIWVGVGIIGVMDRCILDLTGTNALYFYNGRDNGTGQGQGNYEWTLPTEFGSQNYFFVESNIVNGDVGSGPYSTRIFDGFTAAKVVVRFNDVSQAVLAESHATGHAGDDRGPRSQEIYGNKVTSSLARDPNFCAVDLSNGTALVWGNTWNNVYKNIYILKNVRRFSQANGGTYNQAATPDGWGYAGTENNGTGSNWDGGTFNGTDTASGYPAIDQLGRGGGQLLTGTFPTKVNSTTSTIRWPNQPLEPAYFWNNFGSVVPGWGGATVSNSGGARVVQNRDFYLPASGVQTSPTSPFDGTVGVGWGTIANRPTTCTPGVAYFAIDQGSWNTTESNDLGVQMNGASGVLYKCTSANTWSLYYEPQAFPHPLIELTEVGGGGSQTQDPVFDPIGGAYVGNQVIQITSEEGATIRYTLDGTTPTDEIGLIYSSPIGLSSTTTLRAVAYKEGSLISGVTTAIYEITPIDEGGGELNAGVLTAGVVNLSG